MKVNEAALFSKYAISEAAAGYECCWWASTGSGVQQFDPLLFSGSFGCAALDWLNLKSFTKFDHVALEGPAANKE